MLFLVGLMKIRLQINRKMYLQVHTSSKPLLLLDEVAVSHLQQTGFYFKWVCNSVFCKRMCKFITFKAEMGQSDQIESINEQCKHFSEFQMNSQSSQTLTHTHIRLHPFMCSGVPGSLGKVPKQKITCLYFQCDSRRD